MTPTEFINHIYQSIPTDCQDAYVSLWDKFTKESIHIPISKISTITQQAQTLVSQNKDVYYGVALRRPNLLKSQRGKLQDTRGLPGFFLDIDIDTALSAHVAQNLPKNEDQIVEILSVLPPPTSIIDSGHGWHVYWLFNQVQSITHANSLDIAKSLERFQRKAIAHANALGYHVDFTGDIPRVLRLPGTINLKAGLNKPVTVLDSSGPRYVDINALLQASNIGENDPVSNQTSLTDPTQIDPELLKPDPAYLPAQTTSSLKDSFAKLQNQESKELMELCLQGKPFAPAGARDATLQRIASVIAYLAPDRDPGELAVELLNDSLATFEPEDRGKYTQEDRLIWAAEKIERAQIDAREDRVIRARESQALADVLLKQARAAERRDQKLGPAPQGPYTDNEVNAFAKQQNTNIQGFRKRWIIQKGAQYYVYVNGDYQKPLDAGELDVSLPRDLSPAVANGFVEFDTRNAKGEPRRKSSKELLTDYASVARTIVARLDLGHSYYDEATQTFYEATCPLRPLVAQYNSNIDAWLRLLGGTKPDLLLDWIATVSNLDKQSSALYLQGPPGTGKSLLSQGLARLWHMGGPTELVRVLGDWTADLSKCPLIVADEQIPQSFRGQRTSAELRSLIGNPARTLTRKYAHNADLVGAIRLILSANNADMLVFDETLSQADLEAVAGRFLHIIGNKNATQYLNSISTAGWVDNDLIAKHALWLRDNRRVIPGRRFLVEGSARDVSKQLATRGSVAGRVAEWLVRYLCETPASQLAASISSPQQMDLARVGNGQYLVNTNAIVTFWEQYAKSKQLPSTPQVGSALRNLSTKQVRAGKKRYFVIDIEAISSWSEGNLIGDPLTIQERINQELMLKDNQDPQDHEDTCQSIE